MLSRTMYQLTTTLDREHQKGIPITPVMQTDLIAVLYSWHRMALELEQEVERLQVENAALSSPCRRITADGQSASVNRGDTTWVPMIAGGTDMIGGGYDE